MDDSGTAGLRDCGSTLLKYFSFVSICKYLLTAGLREQAFNVRQSWPGVLKFSRNGFYKTRALRNTYLKGNIDHSNSALAATDKICVYSSL